MRLGLPVSHVTSYELGTLDTNLTQIVIINDLGPHTYTTPNNKEHILERKASNLLRMSMAKGLPDP